jgi:hypothetical protein
MNVVNQSDLQQRLFSKWTPERVAGIIDELSGGKSTLRVDVGDVRLTLGDKEYEFAGGVDFNVIQANNGNASYPAVSLEQQENLAPASESGKVHVSTGDVEALRINVVGKRFDVDIEDKKFVKRVIKLRKELAPKKAEPEEDKTKKKKSSSPLAMVRTIADTCKKMGITVAVYYKGHLIATMGADARPTLLQHVTKTDALAINSLYTAIELMI